MWLLILLRTNLLLKVDHMRVIMYDNGSEWLVKYYCHALVIFSSILRIAIFVNSRLFCLSNDTFF